MIESESVSNQLRRRTQLRSESRGIVKIDDCFRGGSHLYFPRGPAVGISIEITYLG